MTACGSAAPEVLKPDAEGRAAPPSSDGSAQRDGGSEPFFSDGVVRLTGDRQLVFSYTGAPPGQPPCGSTPALVATETPDRVTLEIVEQAESRTSDEPIACPAVGHSWSLTADLGRALGGRPVTDAEGAAYPVRAVSLPTALPPGYRLAHESGDAFSYGVVYTSFGGDLLTFSVLADGLPERLLEAYQQLDVVDVNGSKAQLLRLDVQLALAWQPGDQQLWLSSITSGDATQLDIAELLRVARSVR